MKTFIILLVLAATAHGKPPAAHIGFQLSSDSDTQRARVGGGVRFGAVKLRVVIDAQLMSDGKDDVDAIVEWSPASESWALLAGWRTCALAIERGHQWHQQFLLGATGRLPTVLGLLPSFGAELATTIVRHGDNLEIDWLSMSSQRDVVDTMSFNLFLRFDFETSI